MTVEEDARWARLQQNREAMFDTQEAIFTLVRLTVGPYEMPEYEHVPIEMRYAEATAFYYWLVATLVMNSTDYEHKSDYAQWVADAIVSRLPAVAPILGLRYEEYAYSGRSSADLHRKAAKAAQRFLQHMDPGQPVPAQYAGEDFGEGLLDATTHLFRRLPRWV